MEWLKLVIPLIFVAVWILSQLAKNRDQTPRRTKPPPLPKDEDEDEGPRPRRSAGEVDRFLEEVRRRRARAEGRTSPPPVVAEPPRPKPAARRPAPEPARSFPPPIQAPPPVPSPPPTPRMPPAVQPAPVTFRMPSIEPATEVVVAVPLDPRPADRLAPFIPAVVAGPARSSALIRAVSLLRDRQTMMAAIVLREILGPPVSKRPGAIPLFRQH